MSDVVISVRDFKKTFYLGLRRKPQAAAQGISFEVHRGEVLGFLGPNGAGKTTTIKALLGLIRADAGELRLLGLPARSMGWRAKVGFLPEQPTFYDFLSGIELVSWFGRLCGLSAAESDRQARRNLDRVGLNEASSRRLRSYSKGMLQRAGLAQALMGSPEVLILDEPMTGLDPIGRRDVRELILELKGEGRTVFYSTHILPDVEMTCDRVTILHRGRTQQTGKLSDILGKTTKTVSVRLRELGPELFAKLRTEHPGSIGAVDDLQIEVPSAEAAQVLIGQVLPLGAKVEAVQPHRADLETIFLATLGDEAKKGAIS